MPRRHRLSDPVTIRPLPSFIDALAAMLLVLVFIITILSIFSGKVLDEIEGNERAKLAQSQLDADFAALVSADGMEIDIEGTEIRILLPERLLFRSGQAEVRPEGAVLVDQLGARLLEMTHGDIFVEGHTDDRPIVSQLVERFPTNWELSTARASHIVRRLVEVSGLKPNRLTASGMADTRPVESNDTAAGRARNRRIEIRIKP
jgi:chemotaxis protein MotB